MKVFKSSLLISLVLIITQLIVGLVFYWSLPDPMATHWGLYGQVDGYSPKPTGVFFLPILSLGLFLLFLVLPKTDPYKKNFQEFIGYYHTFMSVVFAFMLYLYILVIVWNLGIHFSMIQLMAPSFAGLFYYTSVLISKAKRNWFVGIRTPWTLTNEKVWEKTHQLGSKYFKLAAALSLLGIIFPHWAIFFILIPILLFVVFIYGYSYWEYRKLA